MPKRGGVGDEGESEGLGCQPGMPGNNLGALRNKGSAFKCKTEKKKSRRK